MRLLRSRDYTHMPWKNGGGETIEIAVHPPGADLSGFDWRISTASVTEDGAFSVFEGIDRTLCLLEGKSVDLEIAGVGHRRLTIESPPMSFPGDVATIANLREGPILDLNVMSRRGRWNHWVEKDKVVGSMSIWLPSAWNVLVLMGKCRIKADNFCEDGQFGDTFVSRKSSTPINIGSESEIIVIRVGFNNNI